MPPGQCTSSTSFCPARELECRGSDVTTLHHSFRAVICELWTRGVIPEFRIWNGIGVGLSPLKTTFAVLRAGLTEIRKAMGWGVGNRRPVPAKAGAVCP